MDYPKRLLPKIGFKYISEDISVLDQCYLIRTTRDKNIIDEETGTIKPEYISLQTGHLKDLSTNLLGVYCCKDVAIQISGDNKDYFTKDLWTEGEDVSIPVFAKDFHRDEHKGYIGLLIGEIKDIKIPYRFGDNDGLIAECKILHTPVRSNFWHFSIRWLDENGNTLSDKKNWQKRILSSARALLIEYGRVEFEPNIALSSEQYEI